MQLVVDRIVIGIHDVFLIQPEGIEQGRHRQFAAAVDPGEDDILGVKLEVEPRTAVGNDAAGEEQLARRMGLALVVVEEHAGRTVHLADDHALGAVDDEGAVRGHERHVPHEDILFLDVLDRAGAGIFVEIEHDQAQGDLQRGAVGHVALHAFIDVVFGFFQLVADEFQHAGFVEILDRENRLEDTFDAFAVLRVGLIAGVQEKVVRRFLNLDEVRHFQHFADFAVVFPKTLLAKIGRGHKGTVLVLTPLRGAATGEVTVQAVRCPIPVQRARLNARTSKRT